VRVRERRSALLRGWPSPSPAKAVHAPHGQDAGVGSPGGSNAAACKRRLLMAPMAAGGKESAGVGGNYIWVTFELRGGQRGLGAQKNARGPCFVGRNRPETGGWGLGIGRGVGGRACPQPASRTWSAQGRRGVAVGVKKQVERRPMCAGAWGSMIFVSVFHLLNLGMAMPCIPGSGRLAQRRRRLEAKGCQ
jgi:hypothetical protein